MADDISDDEGKSSFPEGIEETTQGHPSEPAIEGRLVVGAGNPGREPYPDELLDDEE